MSTATTIEWTDATWNPVTGCTKVSPGCRSCYAERITERFHGRGAFATVRVHPDRLTAPLRWRKPRRVFVNSMSDLFHPDVPDDVIDQVYDVIARTPQHTYQVLTKRHARMRSFFAVREHTPEVPDEERALLRPPLPNVWLGVSAETQHWADIRVPALLDTPAAVRFISAEPLLGPVDLTPRLAGTGARLDWVIVGGESGPGARPLELAWVRDIVAQCGPAGVPVFVKQLGGAWARGRDGDSKGGDPREWPADLRVRDYPEVPR